MSRAPEDTLVYVVFKEGIYRHECGGVFATQLEAEQAAAKLAEGEPDTYHGFSVVPFELGVATPRHDCPDNIWKDGEMDEPAEVSRFSKGKSV